MSLIDYGEHVMNMARHAIGLDYHAPKRGKYEPHRNHFEAGPNDTLWEILVYDGYAIKTGESTYHLSPKALDEMESLIGAKILDYENVGRWGRICGNCRYRGEVCEWKRSPHRHKKTHPTTTCIWHKLKIGLLYGGLGKGDVQP